MNFNEDKEQQNVETKYSDKEFGVEIELRKDRLYKLRKTTKIVKPTKECRSPFDDMDHMNRYIEPSETDIVLEDTEEVIFMTDEMFREILEETQNED